eukprot:GEMP01039506.1.p1 GENE.GEMP01039506.1~~GEMP01039506.1.p1  ORF type:complete len:127 (-),score=3.17 GEMP01039506.1:2-382(-)
MDTAMFVRRLKTKFPPFSHHFLVGQEALQKNRLTGFFRAKKKQEAGSTKRDHTWPKDPRANVRPISNLSMISISTKRAHTTHPIRHVDTGGRLPFFFCRVQKKGIFWACICIFSLSKNNLRLKNWA